VVYDHVMVGDAKGPEKMALKEEERLKGIGKVAILIYRVSAIADRGKKRVEAHTQEW
jgi:hypothetical protein